eukprot:5161809-Prymnesium_polylepis.1
MRPQQNSAFFALLRRYCPLFPQAIDREPLELVEPVFRLGEHHPYPQPRPRCWRLLPHMMNDFLIFDRIHTDEDQEMWDWDEDIGNRSTGVIEGEIFPEEDEGEGEDMDDVGEEDMGLE